MTKILEWTHGFDEEALLNAKAGIWNRSFKTSTLHGEQSVKVMLVKSARPGPFILLAGGIECASSFERVVSLQSMIDHGMVIIVEADHDPVAALESMVLRELVEDIDRLLIVDRDANPAWDKLSDPRYCAIHEENVFSDAITAIWSLGMLNLKTAEHFALDIAALKSSPPPATF